MDIKATKSQLKEFKDSIIWHDIVRELEVWKEAFEQEMRTIVARASEENPSTASVLLHMGNIDGRIAAVEYMVSIPDVFISILNTQNKEEELDNE